MFPTIRRAVWVALLAVLAAASAGAQSVEHSDAFEGPDGQRPTGWTIYGAADDGYWMRRGGALHTGNGDDYDPGLTWAVLDQPGSQNWNNYTVGVDFRMVQDRGMVAVAARWKDNRSFYYATLEALRRGNDSDISTQIQIFKMSGGRAQSLALGSAQQGLILPRFYMNTPTGSPVRFEFQVDGSTLRAFVNGNEMLTATDSEFSSGTIAVGQEYNEVYFDNLRVSGTFDPSGSVPIAGSGAGGGGETAWRLLMLDHKPRGVVDGLKSDLASYPFVEVVAESDGTYSLYVGRYPTSAAAAAAAGQLQADGFLLADQTPRSFSTAAAAPSPAPTPVPTIALPELTPAVPDEVREQRELTEISNAASKMESEGNLNAALDLWYKVKARAPAGSAMWQLADENIRRLNLEIGRNTGVPAPSPGGGGLPIGLIAGILGALVVAGVVVVLVLKRKKEPARPAAAPAASKPTAPAGAANAAAAAAALATLPPPTARGPKAEPTPRAGAPGGPSAPVPVGPDARIRPGTMSPAPGHEPTPRAPAPVPAPPRAEPTPRAPRPEPTPRPPQAAPPPRKSTEESGVKLDFLFDEAQPTPSVPAREDTADFFEPPPPDTHTPVVAAEPTPQVVAGTPDQFFYAQDFEGENVGDSPANWKGDYEYASLKVHGEGAGGGGKCLRFEKKNGVGSAYYSCRFPNATGRIGVEFDMRCDDKNKYLLGFYIEKDEDFRQSVHTIVHRTNSSSKPTLRLQNEACNYDFGRWTHIRFEIDLPRHIVDGYVDEKPIAMGTRLNNCPKYVNTLSIRDNLATAGVLLIDNIRIYRL